MGTNPNRLDRTFLFDGAAAELGSIPIEAVPAAGGWSIGINARGTAAYVTDNAGETYVLGQDDTYPVTRGGVTFGYTTVYGDAKRDRNNALDRRLAGLNQVPNTSARNVLRVDLPAAGTYTVRLAFGDDDNAQNHYFEVFDNTTSLFSQSAVATSTHQWADATGAVYSAANWITSNTAQTGLVFATTTFILKYGDPTGVASGSSTLAHVFIQQDSGSPASYTLTADSGSFTLTGQSANLLAGRRLTASAGSFALSGQNANLLCGRTLTAGAGSFSLTGQAANLNDAHVLTASVGVFTLAGNDVGLSSTSVSTPPPTFTGDIGPGDYTTIKREYPTRGELKPKRKRLPKAVIKKVKQIAAEPMPNLDDLQMLAVALEPSMPPSESQELAIQMLARLEILMREEAKAQAQAEAERQAQEEKRRQVIISILAQFKAQQEEDEILLAYLM